MKLIPLTKGKSTMVDDEDYDNLMKYKWCSLNISKYNWYAVRQVRVSKNKQDLVWMHRQLMNLTKGDGIIVDHKDRNSLNNQMQNLRIASRSQNGANKRSSGTSMYLGVCFIKNENRWHSQITFKNKTINLGVFPFTSHGEIQAALTYNEAAIKYHGKFANINIIK